MWLFVACFPLSQLALLRLDTAQTRQALAPFNPVSSATAIVNKRRVDHEMHSNRLPPWLVYTAQRNAFCGTTLAPIAPPCAHPMPETVIPIGARVQIHIPLSLRYSLLNLHHDSNHIVCVWGIAPCFLLSVPACPSPVSTTTAHHGLREWGMCSPRCAGTYF